MPIERARLGRDGRLIIPATRLKELGLRAGDTVVIESDGDSLLLTGYDRAFRAGTEPFAPDRVPGAASGPGES